MSSLATGCRIVLYISFFDEGHGSSSLLVACLNGAALVRSKAWVAKGEKRISTTASSIRLNSHVCGSLDERPLILRPAAMAKLPGRKSDCLLESTRSVAILLAPPFPPVCEISKYASCVEETKRPFGSGLRVFKFLIWSSRGAL
jgi:hypothetical protein